jgi:hypothetical protein
MCACKLGEEMGKKTPTGNWKRAEKAMPEPMVVVGFGKHELADLMGEDMEERILEAFQKQWPPIYRRASACTEDEIKMFSELTNFIARVAAR